MDRRYYTLTLHDAPGCAIGRMSLSDPLGIVPAAYASTYSTRADAQATADALRPQYPDLHITAH